MLVGISYASIVMLLMVAKAGRGGGGLFYIHMHTHTHTHTHPHVCMYIQYIHIYVYIHTNVCMSLLYVDPSSAFAAWVCTAYARVSNGSDPSTEKTDQDLSGKFFFCRRIGEGGGAKGPQSSMYICTYCTYVHTYIQYVCTYILWV